MFFTQKESLGRERFPFTTYLRLQEENALAGRSSLLLVEAELEERQRNERTEVVSLAWMDCDF